MRRTRNSGSAPAPTVVESTSVGRQGHWIPPLALLIIGWLAILFGLACIMIQTQTTEANLQGLAGIDTYKPNIYILTQPWDIFFGNMSFWERGADLIAWIIEIATGIFIVGYSDALDVSGSSGWVMRRMWFIASWALFLFNFSSDFKYGNIPGATNANLGHFEFAVGISAAVCFFPIIGLHLVRKANAMSRV
ncbi:MAG TPA: hypothetical protein VHV10_19675 [Ktedonobacteraceae bacterium]|jgi:hypothetical protein|nr:hypothetical protein [Ktedonobacteraceae bacterium]